jgi:uncharacterized protein
VSGAAVAVIAKAPVPGRVKTRLCPPCTPEQAARLAAASLADVLAAAARAGAGRRVVVLDGEPDGVVPPGFEVVPQRGGGLDERLAGAFDDIGGPALVVGMDTPQVRPEQIAAGVRALDAGAPSVLGGAEDGGYWCIGLQGPCPPALLGVPMSVAHTGAAQRERLVGLGLPPHELDALLDVDDIASARAVAAAAPHTRFARALAAMELGAVATA